MQEMESQLKQAQEKIKVLETRITELTNKYGYESYLNNELLDIVREHHIPVRPGLLRHNRTWTKSKKRGGATTTAPPLCSLSIVQKEQQKWQRRKKISVTETGRF